MQELNQIVLCSSCDGRSFLREIAVFDEFAVVTGIESLPFRYHETLDARRNKKDFVEKFAVPLKRSERYGHCPLCGNRTVFQCKRCGFHSCMVTGANEHECPGCGKSYKTQNCSESYASKSGFVGDAFNDRGSKRSLGWDQAHKSLLRLIDHRNKLE